VLNSPGNFPSRVLNSPGNFPSRVLNSPGNFPSRVLNSPENFSFRMLNSLRNYLNTNLTFSIRATDNRLLIKGERLGLVLTAQMELLVGAPFHLVAGQEVRLNCVGGKEKDLTAQATPAQH
jgi:hypothetical protein